MVVGSPLPCIDSGSVTALWPIILDQFSHLCLPPLCRSAGITNTCRNLALYVGLRDCTHRICLFLWVSEIALWSKGFVHQEPPPQPTNPPQDCKDLQYCCGHSGASPSLLLIPWVDGDSCTCVSISRHLSRKLPLTPNWWLFYFPFSRKN